MRARPVDAAGPWFELRRETRDATPINTSIMSWAPRAVIAPWKCLLELDRSLDL